MLEGAPGPVVAIEDDEGLLVVHEIALQLVACGSLEVEEELRGNDPEGLVEDLDLEADVLERIDDGLDHRDLVGRVEDPALGVSNLDLTLLGEPELIRRIAEQLVALGIAAAGDEREDQGDAQRGRFLGVGRHAFNSCR